MDSQPSASRPGSDSGPSNRQSQPPASDSSDSQWRTTCRTCGSSFKSRNQLMRHLYRSHPGKPGKPKANTRASQTQPPSPPPNPAIRKTEQSQPQSPVHPLNLLTQQQKTAFAAHVLCAIFSVGMKQREGEQRQQQDEQQTRSLERHEEKSPRDLVCSKEELHLVGESLPPPPEYGPAPIPDWKPPDSNSALNVQSVPNRTDQVRGTQRVDGDSELEDSDDDDGGVALFGPALGRLPLGVLDGGKSGGSELEVDIDLD